jgi:hypothetical protein
LDERRPTVRSLRSFDTCGNPAATQLLKEAVDALPARTVVVLVAKDEASSKWQPADDAIIRQLGGKTSLVGSYRASYALIGVKGAQPGQALEALNDKAEVTLLVGKPPGSQDQSVAYSTATLSKK